MVEFEEVFILHGSLVGIGFERFFELSAIVWALEVSLLLDVLHFIYSIVNEYSLSLIFFLQEVVGDSLIFLISEDERTILQLFICSWIFLLLDVFEDILNFSFLWYVLNVIDVAGCYITRSILLILH